MKKIAIPLLLIAILLMASCGKKCRCYRYDGNVDEFTPEELSNYDRTCTGMEQFDFGEVYSICEKTIF